MFLPPIAASYSVILSQFIQSLSPEQSNDRILLIYDLCSMAFKRNSGKLKPETRMPLDGSAPMTA
jgi:hypothetical protein